MIEIEAVVDEDGILRACTVSGHAGSGQQEAHIACAAVSVLMRTAVRTLSARKGITLWHEAPKPGFLALEADYTADGKNFLYAAGVFLLDGLSSVMEEYPNNCRLTVMEDSHGTKTRRKRR